MKKIILLVTISLVILSGCRNKSDHLAALEDICVEDEGVFKNCDALFDKDGSYYSFLIIPKAGAQIWYGEASKNLQGPAYEKNDSLSARIKRIAKDQLSRDFNVWVFYTDKKYTSHVGMDEAYNVINPHVTELYYLQSGENTWEKLDSFSVKDDSEAQKENQWKDDFINKAIAESNRKTKRSTQVVAVPATWQGKYSAYFSYGDIAGQHAGWALEINITNGKITASGDGYQMAFSDELTASESGSELILAHRKNLSGYPRGKDMKPEFTLVKDQGKFYVRSNWIDGDVVTKPAALGYEIDKAGF